ncbi:MAG: hypothetical protein AB1523_09165, partial [Bacillota bacterium]
MLYPIELQARDSFAAGNSYSIRKQRASQASPKGTFFSREASIKVEEGRNKSKTGKGDCCFETENHCARPAFFI